MQNVPHQEGKATKRHRRQLFQVLMGWTAAVVVVPHFVQAQAPDPEPLSSLCLISVPRSELRMDLAAEMRADFMQTHGDLIRRHKNDIVTRGMKMTEELAFVLGFMTVLEEKTHLLPPDRFAREGMKDAFALTQRSVKPEDAANLEARFMKAPPLERAHLFVVAVKLQVSDRIWPTGLFPVRLP